MNKTPIGIIAGKGILPLALINKCQKEKRPFFVAALKGQAEPELYTSINSINWFRLGSAGKIIKAFKKHQVKEVVMIGAVRRPSALELLPDWTTLKFICSVGLKGRGDDNLLKKIVKVAENLGFKIVGIDSLLPDLLFPKGVLGEIKPTESDIKDGELGFKVAKILGQADVGQSVIVQQGLILAVEAIEGTDNLIKRSANLKRKGKGGVLVKVVKPQQERRVDLPTIGLKTVQEINESGFKGIIAEAESCLLSEPEKTIKLANELGVFMMGVEKEKWSKST